MAEKNGIYKCEFCGNTVSVIISGEAPLVCCGQEMTLLQEKTEDQGKEKHVPIIEKTKEGIKVKIGSIPHPMEQAHYIALIQLVKGNEVIIGKRLKPGDKPEADFCCLTETKGLTARALCNIHGLWKSK
jgi:superoxide reductase